MSNASMTTCSFDANCSNAPIDQPFVLRTTSSTSRFSSTRSMSNDSGGVEFCRIVTVRFIVFDDCCWWWCFVVTFDMSIKKQYDYINQQDEHILFIDTDAVVVRVAVVVHLCRRYFLTIVADVRWSTMQIRRRLIDDTMHDHGVIICDNFVVLT